MLFPLPSSASSHHVPVSSRASGRGNGDAASYHRWTDLRAAATGLLFVLTNMMNWFYLGNICVSRKWLSEEAGISVSGELFRFDFCHVEYLVPVALWN